MPIETRSDGQSGRWSTRATATAAAVTLVLVGVGAVVTLRSEGNLFQGRSNPAGLATFSDFFAASASDIDSNGPGGTYGPFHSDAFTSTTGAADSGASTQAVFESYCAPSHFGFDDPMRDPGNLGESSLMMFFGNTLTNGESTFDATTVDADNDIAEWGGSSCQTGVVDRSAYMVPALLDGPPGGSRSIVVPKQILIRHTSDRPADVQPYPRGLQILSGNIDSAGNPGSSFGHGPWLNWGCHDPGQPDAVNTVASIPGTNSSAECPNGWDIQATLTFQQCVATDDGTANGNPALDGNGNWWSHVTPLYSFGTNNFTSTSACPSSHPYRVPRHNIILRFDNPGAGNTAGWRLSTDGDSESPAGAVPSPGGSLHAGVASAWNSAAMGSWLDGCITASRTCRSGQTGQSREFNDLTGATITSNAFNGPYLVDDPSDGAYGEEALPAPITPSSNKLSEILDDFPAGGTIVLPNGTYIGDTLDNLDPTSRLVVVAENQNEVQIVRNSDTVGDTFFWVKNSSNITFAGLWFRDIVVGVSSSQDIDFRYTKHSYPIDNHPDPFNSYCVGTFPNPVGLEINGGSTDIDLHGVDLVDLGNDGLKINGSDGTDLHGVVISAIEHKYLQGGNFNGECFSSDGDNYHYDGIQFVNGSVDNFTLNDSYVGRRIVMQVEDGDDGNLGVDLNNVWLNAEHSAEFPAEYGCVTMLTRITPGANAGAQQTMTLNDVHSFCPQSFALHWTAGGSRDNDLIVNSIPVLASNTDLSSLFDSSTSSSAVEVDRSPAAQWRRQNPYQEWLDNL